MDKLDNLETLSNARQLFDLPEAPIYLSGASRSPMPRKIMLCGLRALKRKSTNPWSIAAKEYSHVDERCRLAWANLLNSTPDHFSFAPSCSYAISAVANILVQRGDICQSDIILILDDQMSSSVYPWQYVVSNVGAQLKVVKIGELNDDWTQAVLESKWWETKINGTSRVKVVCVPNVHWCDGSLLDLEKISNHCRERGAVLVVDATQSLGALPLDVEKIQPDFVAASSHKWLFGPYGICLLYSDSKYHGVQVNGKGGNTFGLSGLWPLEHHEHNRFNPNNIDCLPLLDGDAGYEPRFKAGARAFDSGGRPNPVLMPMACEAVEMILHWGPNNIFRMLREYTEKVAIVAVKLGLIVPSQRAGHIIGISKKNDPEWSDRCSCFLKRNGIIIASRFGHLRAAPGVYNTEAEVEIFCDLLSKFVKKDISKL